MDLDLLQLDWIGLDWIGCYKFCFEFGLDEDFFSRTFFWIPTFGFWLPVHSKEQLYPIVIHHSVRLQLANSIFLLHQTSISQQRASSIFLSQQISIFSFQMDQYFINSLLYALQLIRKQDKKTISCSLDYYQQNFKRDNKAYPTVIERYSKRLNMSQWFNGENVLE